MLKKLLGIVLKPPTPQLFGLVLLTAIVFFGGRMARPWLGLADRTLMILCGAVWVLAALVFAWRRYQSGQRARLIEDRLRGQAKEHKEAARPDRRQHIEALEKQLNEALGALKSSKMGKSALYALPWYIIIGPPGSGKTTLLRESGLSFPQLTHGRGVRGIGGTRNCDWWFTDAGIQLDTATSGSRSSTC
jgi:type VI secretion system protein ImpL